MSLEQRQPLLNSNELAEYLCVTSEYIRKLTREGDIPAIKIKREWRYDLVEVLNALR